MGRLGAQSVKCPILDLSSVLELSVVISSPALGSAGHGVYLKKKKKSALHSVEFFYIGV